MKNKVLFSFTKILLICVISCVSILAVIIATINRHDRIGPVISIDDDVYTAKQLVNISEDYVRKHVRIEGLYLSNISMHLNKSHRGEVILTYTYEKKGHFRRYDVTINSQNHVVDSLNYIERSSTTSTRFMNFAEWRIDSDEAMDIALRTFRNRGFQFDENTIWIDARMRATNNCSWGILLFDNAFREKYGFNPSIFIDAFTGEISGFDLLFSPE